MAPANNLAEQALRQLVIMREITFGSRSREGVDAMAVNLSMLETAKKSGTDPIEILLRGPY